MCSNPAARIFSGMPSISREHTARVASGVTSRSAMPVPPGSDDQLHLIAKIDQRRFNRRLLVGNDFLPRDLESAPAQQVGHGRAGEIGALAPGGRIADGKYGGSFHVSKERSFSCAIEIHLIFAPRRPSGRREFLYPTIHFLFFPEFLL